jgi:carbonic anhydrase
VKKLLKGIIDFRKNVRPKRLQSYSQLALGQSPDTLLIACSDSRVAPNVFASTDPGDLFVVRNVGNCVPPCKKNGFFSKSDTSEIAALEFAILNLKVRNVIVCGHSECGAMNAIFNGISDLSVESAHLRSWLINGQQELNLITPKSSGLSPQNQLSQLNVITQIDHIRTYPFIRRLESEGKLTLHGWWFDIANADVYSYDWSQGSFILLEEAYIESLLSKII